MVMISPLHTGPAIDGRRWDAERLLGRLIVVVHAAFLDAGFVPLGAQGSRSRRPGGGTVPKQAGRTASALSLRYGAPQLLHHREAAAVLRMLAHGRRHLVLYAECDPWPVERCVLVDALAAAPLLAGGLDGTARALRRDARLAGLWRRLSDDLCRGVLADMCRRRGVALEPSFMSLPGDARAAVLARLASGADLASVERVCTGLRRLVAERDRQFWKPRYDALALRGGAASWLLPAADDCSRLPPETSWKERYVTARQWKPPASHLGMPGGDAGMIRSYPRQRPVDRDDESEPEADPVADRRNRIAAGRRKRGAGRGRSPPSRVQENRRRGAGAIYAPSCHTQPYHGLCPSGTMGWQAHLLLLQPK
ncbi:hypothetical protein PVAP13_3KG230100 [Panicum virgatum]|uniref:F-box domain-containing protein n=1 Tax=Panicum virgatum TaxID=38727 RepID=A0A8T0UUR7_PANVG|nr:hypothetical protein PVAP13_3KG230100 [Panicum virgatum]